MAHRRGVEGATVPSVLASYGGAKRSSLRSTMPARLSPPPGFVRIASRWRSLPGRSPPSTTAFTAQPSNEADNDGTMKMLAKGSFMETLRKKLIKTLSFKNSAKEGPTQPQALSSNPRFYEMGVNKTSKSLPLPSNFSIDPTSGPTSEDSKHQFRPAARSSSCCAAARPPLPWYPRVENWPVTPPASVVKGAVNAADVLPAGWSLSDDESPERAWRENGWRKGSGDNAAREAAWDSDGKGPFSPQPSTPPQGGGEGEQEGDEDDGITGYIGGDYSAQYTSGEPSSPGIAHGRSPSLDGQIPSRRRSSGSSGGRTPLRGRSRRGWWRKRRDEHPTA